MPLRNSAIPEELNQISGNIVDSALKVHRALGPGLLESVYETCLAHELRQRGHPVRSQVPVPLIYEGVNLDLGFRIDLLVSDLVVVEVKSVTKNHPLFRAQLLTYLRLSHLRLGLLINFNVLLIKDGIQRIAN